LPPRSPVTTKVLQRVTWSAAIFPSFRLAAEGVNELVGVKLSEKQVRRLATEVGRARLDERDAAVVELQTRLLPQQQKGSLASEPPELAVISVDGGRYQRRDHFRPRHDARPARVKPKAAAATKPTRTKPTRTKPTLTTPTLTTPAATSSKRAAKTHWRETKVGLLLSHTSKIHDHDPAPEFPEWLATSPAIAELAHAARLTAVPPPTTVPPSTTGHVESEDPSPQPSWPGEYQPPKLCAREVVASSQKAADFAQHLAARAWQRGFPRAARQAFVCDGATANWTIQREHFSRATPILDLMHALAYAWSAAADVDAGASYRGWAEAIWQGRVAQVIEDLETHRTRLGLPPETDDQESLTLDPEEEKSRHPVQRAITYYRNNAPRMHYPEYRRQGLPLTSSHVESTVKQINQRIKGSEKFWNRATGDAILQLRADLLSDSRPLDQFWTRWQAQQTGANRYHTAA